MNECEEVASDLGLDGGVLLVLWFPPSVATGYNLDFNMA